MARAIRLLDREREALQRVHDLLLTDHKHVSIAALAQLAGMNRYKLTYGFRIIYGKAIHEFLQAARMRLAYRLLLDGELSVKEVAARCGYNNQHNFSTAFKRCHGISPSSLRR